MDAREVARAKLSGVSLDGAPDACFAGAQQLLGSRLVLGWRGIDDFRSLRDDDDFRRSHAADARRDDGLAGVTTSQPSRRRVDLHDSAIQPYLGLKYAVECVAMRIPAENPARAEVDALAELVNAEVASLRELISGLRTGARGSTL